MKSRQTPTKPTDLQKELEKAKKRLSDCGVDLQAASNTLADYKVENRKLRNEVADFMTREKFDAQDKEIKRLNEELLVKERRASHASGEKEKAEKRFEKAERRVEYYERLLDEPKLKGLSLRTRRSQSRVPSKGHWKNAERLRAKRTERLLLSRKRWQTKMPS